MSINNLTFEQTKTHMWSSPRLHPEASFVYIYMLPLAQIIQKNKVIYYSYADDGQLYIVARGS